MPGQQAVGRQAEDEGVCSTDCCYHTASPSFNAQRVEVLHAGVVEPDTASQEERVPHSRLISHSEEGRNPD